MVQCKTCPANTFSRAKATSCIDCASSQVSQPGSGGCTTCLAGTYVDRIQSQCVPCPAGTYSANNGATACTPCEVGKSTEGSSEQTFCLRCEKGKYADTLQTMYCTSCPAGTYGSQTGAQNVSACIRCAGRTVSWGRGSTQCFVCPEDAPVYQGNKSEQHLFISSLAVKKPFLTSLRQRSLRISQLRPRSGPQVEPDEHIPKRWGQRPGVCKLRLHISRQHLLRVSQQHREMHPVQELHPAGRIQSGHMHRLNRHAVPAMSRMRQGHELLQLQLHVQPALNMHAMQTLLHNRRIREQALHTVSGMYCACVLYSRLVFINWSTLD